MNRSRSVLEWIAVGVAALAVLGTVSGCERTISDEDFEESERTPPPEEGPGPTPTPGDFEPPGPSPSP
jgi:hypothetical protein